MDGFRTRGQPVAVAAIQAMLRSDLPHAILLSGPEGVGKATLARDLAAALLCVSGPGSAGPCGACRGCRMVRSGNHPDLHVLGPEGAGGQIRIGDRTNPDPGTVRRLLANLALLPVEGGARVAIVEHADRMNEDAQSAILKTLEEPPARVTVVLCADDEERLLPTIHSRCARIRLGPVGVRELESILAEHGIEAPVAARLARLSSGRPGTALAWATAPDAVAARGEIARTLLDLLAARPGARLAAVADLLGTAGGIAGAVRQASDGPASDTRAASHGRRRAARPLRDPEDEGVGAGGGAEEAVGSRAPVAERRRAALALLAVWREVARDLAIAGLGLPAAVRDPGLLDDLDAARRLVTAADAARFLERLAETAELLEANVSPELLMETLVLAWPRPRAA